MKIKSIKLTSDYEIKNVDPTHFYPQADKSPLFQIEYEESTTTGLTATGEMLLSKKIEEKVYQFFKELEQELMSEYEEVSPCEEPNSKEEKLVWDFDEIEKVTKALIKNLESGKGWKL